MKAAARRDGGFTLIELMIIVAVLGLIAAISVPVWIREKRIAEEKSAVTTVRAIVISQIQHKQKFGRYALSVGELVANGVLGEPFKVDIETFQRKGAWEFMTAPPGASGGIASASDRFRVGAQPAGETLKEQLFNGDKMFYALENGRMFFEHFDGTFHTETVVRSYPDSMFGSTIIPLIE